MPVFAAVLSSFSFLSLSLSQPQPSSSSSTITPSLFSFPFSKHAHYMNARMPLSHTTKLFVSSDTPILHYPSSSRSDPHSQGISADWQAAKAYKDSGFIYNGLVEGFNGGGLIVRFYSLMGFLPFPLLSPLHSCKEPEKTIQEIAEGLLYSLIPVKVIDADEGTQNLVFSEKEAAWSRYSEQVKVGDIFEGRVSSVEDYGVFVHLRFPDGLYHLTGLVHISEVSRDLVRDVRDILTECDEVRVKVISVDREKSRISLSIKQLEDSPLENLDGVLPQGISSDWQAAKAYKDSGFIYNGIVEGFNGGGLIVRFYSLLGFLPFQLLSPLHSCREPEKTIQEIAEGLIYSLISVKVIEADEGKRNLVFSEKEAAWSRYSEQVKAGDIFYGRVSSVEDYGAFVHLRFPDGLYHLTGLVHISEVSWDLVGDVRDILTECDEVRVKVVSVDREKSRISLSIKQLEEDPLLEDLDRAPPQDGLAYPNSLGGGDSSHILPLPGLERILEELLQEDGIDDARIRRQGLEKRVVSQDLQLWLSNAPPTNRRFNLLARAGNQEIHLTTSLDQEGIKRALQRVLERIP